MHEVLLCVQTATNMDGPKRMKFNNDSYNLKSEDEMAGLFSCMPEAMENTARIVARFIAGQLCSWAGIVPSNS